MEDLGRFVNNPAHIRPSSFDERAAMPVLIDYLPTLTDPQAVQAVAAHLNRPWARPAAYDALYEAFVTWARDNQMVGWTLGDSLSNAAEQDQLSDMVLIARDGGIGTARQMVVYSMWRFRSDSRVEATLIKLLGDPDVALHAMTALRRTIGNEAALPHLRSVRDAHPNEQIRPGATPSKEG